MDAMMMTVIPVATATGTNQNLKKRWNTYKRAAGKKTGEDAHEESFGAIYEPTAPENYERVTYKRPAVR